MLLTSDLIDKKFYKYANNRYLRDILITFYARNQYKLFLYMHQYQSNDTIFMLIKIQKSEKDEPQSLFSKLKQQTLWLVFLLIIVILTNSNKLYHFVFYLVNLVLDYSTIPCGFNLRPYGQIITSDNTVHLS